MTEATNYRLKGNGPIDAVWMRECMCLFRLEGVNIRKLVYYPDLMAGNQAASGQNGFIEVQFVLKPDEEAGHRVFLSRLERCLSGQRWDVCLLEPA